MRVDARQEGYKLMQDGLVALSEVEANGICIDMKKLDETTQELANKIEDLREQLQGGSTWRHWRKRFGVKTKLTSRDQLAVIIQDELGHEMKGLTRGGKLATDEEVLQKIDHPFVRKYLKLSKYEKALGTFLRGIESEICDGRLHPVFNLHTVRTFRGSSDSPNFQNMPVRDKEIARIIRSLMVASPGHILVENDFKGIEVSVAACYCKDRNLISYITTPGKDMHRDMAARLYFMKPKEISKDARYTAKNMFVFPQFYGDFYVSCARSLWEAIDRLKLTGMREHLREQGIRKLGACDPEQKPMEGTFEKHVQEVEYDFWNNRFREYAAWKKRFWQQYLERGWFDLFSGFRISGVFRRNQVVNWPIQGSAFHCLLWTLIQVNKALHKYRMKSKIVGQIHDSLISDVREDELRAFLEIVEETVKKRLRKHWPWLIVPMEIEYEIVPRDGSWFGKKEVKFKAGRFEHPTKPGRWTGDADKFLNAL